MGTKDVTREFATYGDMLEYAAGRSEMSDSSRSSRKGDSWSGPEAETFNAALDLAQYGWPEGLAKVKKMADDIWNTVATKIEKQENFLDTEGSFVDIGQFLTGEPECMVNFVNNEKLGHGKIISLTVNCVASSGVSTDTMFNRGAAIVALAGALEKLGYSVEIWSRSRIDSGGSSIIYKAPVKIAGQAMDMDRIAYCLCAPSYLRRIVFSMMERESSDTRRYYGINPGGGYGYPPDEEETTEEGKGIFVPAVRYGTEMETQADAVKWVMSKLEKLVGYVADAVPVH